jgi:hypothetical protein
MKMPGLASSGIFLTHYWRITGVRFSHNRQLYKACL